MHISNALLLLLVSSLLGHIARYVCDAAYFYRCCTFHGGLFTSLSVCLFVRVSDTGVILQKRLNRLRCRLRRQIFMAQGTTY